MNPLKNTVANLCAFMVVAAFIAAGIIPMIVQGFLGIEIKPQEAWMSAMLSLASAALGFFLGTEKSGSGKYTEEQFQAALRAIPPGMTVRNKPNLPPPPDGSSLVDASIPPPVAKVES